MVSDSPHRSPSDRASLRTALHRVLAYAEHRDYAGYSKFDALNSKLLNALSLGINPLRWAMAQAVYRFPVNLRPMLGVQIGRNPKGIGLFASTYLHCAVLAPDVADDYHDKARALLTWLSGNTADGYHGACWGYNHPWPNFRFNAPSNFPNLVVTGNAIIAFLHAYERLGDPAYLEIARSSIDFILNDLNTLRDSDTERAISYIPGSQWIVLNNQGLAAVMMAWVAKHTGEQELRDMAYRHVNFLVAQQTDYGAWYYAYPANSSPVTHDNYHTGNVLDWLLLYRVFTGDNTFESAYQRGLAFYRDHLFLANGAPKHRHNVCYPHDIHGAAQGAITFSRAVMHGYPDYQESAEQALHWALTHMQAEDGHFYYMRHRFMRNRTSLMRWNQAWMALALSTTLLAADGSASESSGCTRAVKHVNN